MAAYGRDVAFSGVDLFKLPGVAETIDWGRTILALGHSLGIEAELFGFIAAALYAPARLAYEGKLLRTLADVIAPHAWLSNTSAGARPSPPDSTPMSTH